MESLICTRVFGIPPKMAHTICFMQGPILWGPPVCPVRKQSLWNHVLLGAFSSTDWHYCCVSHIQDLCITVSQLAALGVKYPRLLGGSSLLTMPLQRGLGCVPLSLTCTTVTCMLRAQDWSRLRIQSLVYHSQGPLGKDYFRTTIFFPANFVTLLAVIRLDGEHYFSAGTYTPNNIKL